MKVHRSIVAVRYCDLPRMETHVSEEAGFSIYRGVVVRWDEDYDGRVLDFIDDMHPSDLEHLFAVQEHEGGIAFRWKGHVPEGYAEGDCLEVRDSDVWSVHESTVVGE